MEFNYNAKTSVENANIDSSKTIKTLQTSLENKEGIELYTPEQMNEIKRLAFNNLITKSSEKDKMKITYNKM